MMTTPKFSKDAIKNLIHTFILKVKNDEIDEQKMIRLYSIFKRHELSSDEISWAKNIANRIKKDELTEEMLIEKANKWLSERSK